ncbi:hypothetical protein [Streptomyces sp. NPDC046631]|uniref:hypothetical protein n=1 Tax=unclassified Streptomyces TaxID=2593676 RepID=UPI00340BDE6A
MTQGHGVARQPGREAPRKSDAAGRIDRLGRWYTALTPLAALHAHLADALSDLRDPKAMGHYWWASAGAALTLGSAAALLVAFISAAL